MEELIEFRIKQVVEPKNISFSGIIVRKHENKKCLEYVFKISENNKDNMDFNMPKSSEEINKTMIVQIIIANIEKKNHSWEISEMGTNTDTYRLIMYPNMTYKFTNKFN